jgi:methionine-rich copper-binding protein CopC
MGAELPFADRFLDRQPLRIPGDANWNYLRSANDQSAVVDQPPDSTDPEGRVGNSVTTLTKGLLAVIVGALSATVWASPALSHNSLAGSNPENGKTVDQTPETVTLTFLATVDPAKMKVDVSAPDGGSAVASAARADGRTVTVGIKPGPAGDYTVSYEVGSADGHRVKGKIRFTAANAAPAPPAPSSAAPSAAPTSAAPAAAASAIAAAPTAGELAADQSSSVWPWLVGVLAVLLAAAATGFWILRRRRTKTA